MIQLKIKVTKDVLEATKGCRDAMLNTNCAIAFSIREIWPKAWVSSYGVKTDTHQVGNAMAPVIKLPEVVIKFMKAFDNANPVERTQMPELQFTVDVPDSIINDVNIDEVRLLLANSKTLELV